jgi:hypothetical protein
MIPFLILIVVIIAVVSYLLGNYQCHEYFSESVDSDKYHEFNGKIYKFVRVDIKSNSINKRSEVSDYGLASKISKEFKGYMTTFSHDQDEVIKFLEFKYPEYDIVSTLKGTGTIK